MKLGRNIAITAVCLILGVILAWQYKSLFNYKKVASLENKTINELKDMVIAQQDINYNLRNRNTELEDEIRKYETIRGNTNLAEGNLKKELDRARIMAGLYSVKGKGVIITVSDSDYANVSESNILEVLNELRASDAQAISVNDERIVAMTEVREAGRYMMINGKQMLSPFIIKAIADPEKLEHTLQMIGGVTERLTEKYLLNVDIKKSEEIIIPRVPDDESVIKTNLLNPINQ